ncbi:MAG TPA: VTT domain-containing protein [Bacilli bacterium]
MMKNQNKAIRTLLFIIFLLIMIGITIYLLPLFIELSESQEARDNLKEYIDEIGFWGWLLMLGVQVLQVIIAFLPGEPIEVIMGALFGPIGGTLTCMLGIAIGTIAIFELARLIGMPFISLFIDPEKLNQYKFLNSTSKRDITVFTLFFIPGTPKDLLTYFVPFIKMKPLRFIIISIIARIPSIITSTIIGDNITKENWPLVITMFISVFVVAIVGILVNSWYMKKHSSK